MNKIPMVDVLAWHRPIQKKLEEKAVQVLRSGRFIMGEEVEAFEQEAAQYLGAKYAISCANGTDALVLSLHAAGIGPGDEVLTTGFTFFATVEAIMQVGATPVLVDIDSETFNIDPVELERSITSRCRAVLAVHLFGLPAALNEIQAVCDRHGLKLLEDCAQSFGASYQSRKTGNYGLLGAFSFFPSKNLGGFGDGGLVITSDLQVAETVRMLRNHGSACQYYHECSGYNSRLDEIQAGLLRIKLQYIEEFNNDRRKIAEWYRELLQDTDILCPEEREEHIYHQFTVVLPSGRDMVKKRLAGKGVSSAIYYPLPLNKQRALAGLASEYELPVCEQLSEHCLSLPIYPGMTRGQVESVVGVLVKAMH
ncbi:DegT/DnrJ/EryC1/StrS family aminotransferase [Endozoicomonas elysicola]|uniref:Erythromycin biosynthesis sensory transduction protein eryC1 n=1 Tax=Endozoicomonas elysicola TaxID=305900 RepID=A0A081KGZ8_9GAMM|nr:DegT/DnrJ/EryC1/StrS family aminotransferase [Endozoicomonas elysicola]KEI73424.1 erythromycin biosynthesis sensory transduction protein eryC1 [Endozoicomonas elysicola]